MAWLIPGAVGVLVGSLGLMLARWLETIADTRADHLARLQADIDAVRRTAATLETHAEMVDALNEDAQRRIARIEMRTGIGDGIT